jgi:hypothetical protein
MQEPRSTQSTARTRRAWPAAILAAIAAGTVLWSGFACAAGRWDLSLWPWNRGWYMFSRDDGRAYHLEITGRLEDGSTTALDLGRWFRREAAFDSSRGNEVDRSPASLHALAMYTARRHNATAPPGRRVVAVTVNDLSWPRQPGRRERFADVPRSRLLTRTHFRDVKVPP